MPRVARTEAGSSLYHITARGCGRRRLFEGNPDRAYFVKLLDDNARWSQVQLKAWCLMENHFHLLVRGTLTSIAHMMHRLSTVYAFHFNKEQGHIGHVFQGRYHSVPVETDEQLLATIRYIHLNPVAEGLAPLEKYKWSSYAQYLGVPGICELADMCKLFGTVQEFRRFHECAVGELPPIPNDGPRLRISDTEAAHLAAAHFGPQFAEEIPSLPKESRDEALGTLFELGISVRQIERLTGIGRGAIQRARKRLRAL